ncbi:MAG TPA: EamA family transporter [Candidatus Deferrimicrobiaceae bacterium]
MSRTPVGRQATAAGRARAGLVLTMLLWGSAYATSKMIVQEVPPDAAAVLRFGIGALLMVGIHFARSARPVPRRDAWPALLLQSALGVAGYNFCFFRGVKLAPASDAAMIIPTLSPVVATLFGMVFLREPARAGRLAGLALCVTGAALFFGETILPGADPARMRGDLFLSAAGACWALSSLVSRRLLERTTPFQAAGWSLLLGTAMMLSFSVPEMTAIRWSALSPAFWWVLAYLIAFPTVLAYIFWMKGIGTLGAGTATAFMFLSPFFGLLMSVAFLGERMTAVQVAGGAVIMAGLWLVNRPAPSRAPALGSEGVV